MKTFILTATTEENRNQLVTAIETAGIDCEVKTDQTAVVCLFEDYQPDSDSAQLLKTVQPLLKTIDFTLITRDLEPIAEQLQSEREWWETYYMEDTDNPLADYCCWGWKESGGLLDNYHTPHLEPETEKLVEIGKQLVPDEKELDQVLFECSDVTLTAGIGAVYDELFSMNLGEVSEELSDELKEVVGELTEPEIEVVERLADSYLNGDYIVMNLDYNRWSVVLDYDQLEERLTSIAADQAAENENLNTLEVFKSCYEETENDNGETEIDLTTGETEGWFYWFSLPGCIPDSEPFGPFDTELLAITDSLENFG